MLVGFNLALPNLIPNSLLDTYLQTQVATRKEVASCFFHGAPCTDNFCSVKCSKYLLRGFCIILPIYCVVAFAESKV